MELIALNGFCGCYLTCTCILFSKTLEGILLTHSLHVSPMHKLIHYKSHLFSLYTYMDVHVVMHDTHVYTCDSVALMHVHV